MSEKINYSEIEKKWSDKWENEKIYRTKDDGSGEKKFILDMFPYPSGLGLHIGHVESYTATDIYSRYLRMNGYDVLHPQGWDAFGLPAENFAVKTGIHPSITTQEAIKTFKRQINSLGFSYDWDREINSSTPEYYKWTQWMFLFLYKNGLAYKGKGKVNWCDKCQTVLANEQAEGGHCERCETPVVQKDLEQWYFKITDFIEDKTVDGKLMKGLVNGLDEVDWPESTKLVQKNWIGRSEGAIVDFELRITNYELRDKISVFTTRLDTIFGCTYCVVAPEHSLIANNESRITNYGEVKKYIEQAKNKTDLERMEMKEKTGVRLEGIMAVNPFTKEEIPVFVADYVLGGYGTGAVMAVPAHDERDWVFAQKFGLAIKNSVAPFFPVSSGPDAVRADKPTLKRNTVYCLVKHWSEDKYLCLDWTKFGWHSGVIGGVEADETFEQAALREVQEETGYKRIKITKKYNNQVQSYFYGAHKETNIYATAEMFLLQLESDERSEILEEHGKNHDPIWVEATKMEQFLNIPVFVHFWNWLKDETINTDDGIVIDSDEYSGLTSQEAREKMSAWLSANNLGGLKVNYRIRDWLVSRQRYWGAPIPIIYCPECGEVPVPEKDLPVLLPTDVDFKPTGESPLIHSKTFHDVKCPKCGAAARRESDTMDTFVCSSWYYLRYSDMRNDQEFASQENLEKWLPIDLYVGGAEHSVLHLLYSRFFTKALQRYGYVKFNEPFQKLRHQGMILAEDGTKMSKSKGNVINPDDIVKVSGADALRMYEMFMGPLDEAKPWTTKGIVGIERFLDKAVRLSNNIAGVDDKETLKSLHKTIKKVGEDIRDLKFNTAISQLMILLNKINDTAMITKDTYEKFLILLAPFAPFTAEELWSKIGNDFSIHRQSWPAFVPSLIVDDEVNISVSVNGKFRGTIIVGVDSEESEVVAAVMASEIGKKYIASDPKKVIFVKNKIINFII